MLTSTSNGESPRPCGSAVPLAPVFAPPPPPPPPPALGWVTRALSARAPEAPFPRNWPKRLFPVVQLANVWPKIVLPVVDSRAPRAWAPTPERFLRRHTPPAPPGEIETFPSIPFSIALDILRRLPADELLLVSEVSRGFRSAVAGACSF